MGYRNILLFALSCVLLTSCGGAMTSPNGKVRASFGPGAAGRPSLAVSCRNGAGEMRYVIEVSDMGVVCGGFDGTTARLTGVGGAEHILEHYEMPTGKRRDCMNEASEYLCTLADASGREMALRIRLYNDGVAFRYELPDQEGMLVSEELTTYRIGEGTRRWMQPYNTSYEDFYPQASTGEGGNRHWGYPALVEGEGNVWVLVTEAGIERWHSASSLYNDAKGTDYRVCPDENTKPYSGDWHSPWRVLIVGGLDDVVESTLVTDVSEPCRIDDTDWIRTGGVSWIYWAHNHGSRDYAVVTQYVDMAAALGLPYVLIDWEWDVMGNGGDIDDALRYAAERGVLPLLWYNSSTAWSSPGAAGPLFRLNTPEAREKEYAMLRDKGVAGIKIDFFEGDTQKTMEYCVDLLEDAARYGLMVNFHGATVPRGWQRTYPNFMTAEGVYGAEWYNNNGVLTDRAAAHNATLPFTRNVVGSMDYTPCTFSDSQHPHITTHAHELALPVVFESSLQHWADRPESYLAQPEAVQRLIGTLPTVWDDTRLVSGYPGEWAALARRSGDVWYVGVLNGSDHSATLPLEWDFLPQGEYRITTFADGDGAASPWAVTTAEMLRDSLPVSVGCKPRGGVVMVIEPVKR